LQRRWSYTDQTIKKLCLSSGNICAFPGCSQKICDSEYDVIVGTISHIEGIEKKGPRHNESLSEKQVNDYGNLILFCCIHHTIVDRRPQIFTVQKLKQIKKQHTHYKSKQDTISEDVSTRMIKALSKTKDLTEEQKKNELHWSQDIYPILNRWCAIPSYDILVHASALNPFDSYLINLKDLMSDADPRGWARSHLGAYRNISALLATIERKQNIHNQNIASPELFLRDSNFVPDESYQTMRIVLVTFLK